MLRAIFAMILTLILVIGIHEAGHALAAKTFGVTIERIAIGFGKPFFLWKTKRGLELALGIIPLGGYVQLLDSRSQNGTNGANATIAEKDFHRCFDKQAFWKRACILLAGGLANLLLTIIALVFFYMLGFHYIEPIVPDVLPNSMMSQAGLKAHDKIIAIDNEPMSSWRDLSQGFLLSLGKKNVSLTVVDPNHQRRQLSLNLSKKLSLKSSSFYAALGISLDFKKQSDLIMPGKALIPAIKEALHKTWRWLVFYLMMIKQIVTGTIPFSLLLGPIGLFFITIKSFAEGLTTFIYFIASFSLAIGLVNLFPIPGLDGGSIILALIEKIRGKAISVALEVLLYRLAMIAFFMFFMHLIKNDVQRYWIG
jgi:regulator of sigma E protease